MEATSMKRSEFSDNRPKFARTYRLDRQTVARIDQLTEELGIWPSELANLLLTRALDEVQAGRWPLAKIPIKFSIEWR